jgi:large subunit ribosomal protein L9
MKLILTQQVGSLGGPGDIVEVKDGYGRNFLVPRGMAIRWTRGAESQVSQIRRGREVREIHDLSQAQQLAGELAALSVKLPARAGQGARLFAIVTSPDFVDAFKTAGGPSLDKRRIELPAAHIKTVGTHTVSVRLHADVSAPIIVEVTPES